VLTLRKGIFAVLPDGCAPFQSNSRLPLWLSTALDRTCVDTALVPDGEDGTLLFAAQDMAGHFVPPVGTGCGIFSFLPKVEPDIFERTW